MSSDSIATGAPPGLRVRREIECAIYLPYGRGIEIGRNGVFVTVSVPGDDADTSSLLDGDDFTYSHINKLTIMTIGVRNLIEHAKRQDFGMSISSTARNPSA